MEERKPGARASQVGSWWGHAAPANRRSGDRRSEEIDIVERGAPE